MKRFLILFALISACFAIPAHADNIQNYYLDFDAHESITGYITIDTTTGTPLRGDVFVYYPYNNEFVEELNGNLTGFSEYENNVFFELTSNVNPNSGYLAFQLPTSSLVGYQGGSVCRGNGYISGLGCAQEFGTFLLIGDVNDTVGEGSLIPTPEPSTLLLLGSGGLGLLGAARRRLKL